MNDHITIGGKRIEIIHDPDLVEYGTFDADAWEIRIGPSARANPIETLRHEMVHACFAVAGLSHLRRFEEEVIVRCLENLLFPALEQLETIMSHGQLRTNPKLDQPQSERTESPDCQKPQCQN
jgi:hypothetical protein